MLKRICTTHSLIHTKTLQQYIQIEYFFIDVVFPAGIHTRADWWHRMCVVGWMNVERPPSTHEERKERKKKIVKTRAAQEVARIQLKSGQFSLSLRIHYVL